MAEIPKIKSYEEKLPTGEVIMVRRVEYSDFIHYDVKLSQEPTEEFPNGWGQLWHLAIKPLGIKEDKE